jgi:hypothetical protein
MGCHIFLSEGVQAVAQLSVGHPVAGDSHKSIVGGDHGDDQSLLSGGGTEENLDDLDDLDDLDPLDPLDDLDV